MPVALTSEEGESAVKVVSFFELVIAMVVGLLGIGATIVTASHWTGQLDSRVKVNAADIDKMSASVSRVPTIEVRLDHAEGYLDDERETLKTLGEAISHMSAVQREQTVLLRGVEISLTQQRQQFTEWNRRLSEKIDEVDEKSKSRQDEVMKRIEKLSDRVNGN